MRSYKSKICISLSLILLLLQVNFIPASALALTGDNDVQASSSQELQADSSQESLDNILAESEGEKDANKEEQEEEKEEQEEQEEEKKEQEEESNISDENTEAAEDSEEAPELDLTEEEKPALPENEETSPSEEDTVEATEEDNSYRAPLQDIEPLASQALNGAGQLIVLDPGHGGTDPGATATYNGITYKESELNLNMANRIRSYLQAYGFKVLMTRESNSTYVSLQDRVSIANRSKGIFFLSIHHDSYTSSSSNGSSTHYSTYRPGLDNEGIYESNSIYYDKTPCAEAIESAKMADKLAVAMSSTGFANRGKRDHNLYVTKNTNIPSVLIECGFMTNPSDMQMILSHSHQDTLAKAVAQSILEQYGQANEVAAPSVKGVSYRSRVKGLGWQGYVSNGEISGTVGKALPLEAMNIQVQGIEGVGISYKAHVQNIGWMDNVQNGQMAGSSALGSNLEAMQIELTGSNASKYSVQYQVHVRDIGWMNWVSDGQTAGTTGKNKPIEAIRIKIVERTPEISYSAHVRNIGWQSYVSNGELAGTTGKVLPIEGLIIKVDNLPTGVSISYRAHVQDIGWQNFVNAGELAGTTGRAKNVEALEIKLTGANAANYSIQYQVHVRDIGWMNWVSNGQTAGTTGRNKPVEAIRIKIVANN